MPSSSKKVLKDLHLASSLGKLNDLATPDLPTKVRLASATAFCKSADKVYLVAQDHDLNGDEENAYVFFMRYFNIICLLKKTKQYVDNKVYYNNLIGTSKLKRSIERAESLQGSLKTRYEELSKKKQEKEKEIEEAKKREEEDKRNSKQNKAGQADITDSDSGVETGSLDSDIDILLSGNGVSSSADVYQRLKVSHNAILTPKTSENTNGDLIRDIGIPNLSNEPRTKPCLTAQELYALLEKGNLSQILVLDCRPRQTFATNHINRSCCINIPAELLDEGVSVGSIERRLPEATRKIWKQRGEKDFVIIMDESTQVPDISSGSRIQRLKDVIYTFDPFSSLKKEPLFLDGGFHSWLWHYPSLALKSELPQVSSKSKVIPSVDLSTLDYPELPDENEASLPEPSLPLNAEKGPNKGNHQYPVLPHLKQVGKESIQGPSIDTGVRPGQINLHPQGSSVSVQPGIPAPVLNSSHEQHVPNVPHASVPQLPNQVPPKIGESQVAGLVHAPSQSGPLFPKSSPSQTGIATVLPSSAATSQSSSSPSLASQLNGPTLQPPAIPSQIGLPVPHLGGMQSLSTGAPSQPLPVNVPLSHSPIASSQPSTRQSPVHAPLPQPSIAPSLQSIVPSSLAANASSSGPSPSPVVSTASKPSPLSGQISPSSGPTVSTPSSLPVNINSKQSVTGSPSSLSTVTPNVIPHSSPGVPPTGMSVGSMYSGGSGVSVVAAPHATIQQGQQIASVGQPSWVDPATGGLIPHTTTQVSGRNAASPSQHQSGTPVGMPLTNSQPSTKPAQSPGTSQAAKTPPSSQPSNQAPAPSGPARSSSYVTTPGLPQGWEKVAHADGRVYYKDHNTQSTHWKAPKIPNASSVTPQTSGQTQRPQAQRQLSSDRPTLQRSNSSPNLKLSAQSSGPKTPVVDRLSKPDPKKSTPARPVINRSAKPLSGHQLDNLNPSHGGIGAGLTGLRNLGNTCYMNSVVQCLSSVAPLAAYFLSGTYREDINRNNRDGTQGELAEQFSVIIRVLHSGQFKCVSPGDFKRTVGKFKGQFSGCDQQDSQELLAFLMDGVHEDLNKVKQKPFLKAPGDDLDLETAAKMAWENHKKRNESLLMELFDGLFMSTVQCMVCQKESYTFETFSNLTLPLPTHRNHCSLQDCLNLFTRTEKMSGDDKWFCPKCQQRRDASKQIQIWRLPAILIVHLKRFQYDGMWRQKLQTGVSFPMEQLDMSPYVVGPKSRPPYNLHAVSNHYGTMHGGHYTAFCKSVYDKRWYKFDDQFVTEMSSKNVVSSAGYLLFYTSFDFQPPKYQFRA